MSTTNKASCVITMTQGWKGAQPLSADLRAAAQRVLDAEGPAKAAARLDVSVAALTRACTGAPVSRGTAALLRLAIERTSSSNES